jgi:hypothetical protein
LVRSQKSVVSMGHDPLLADVKSLLPSAKTWKPLASLVSTATCAAYLYR